MENDKKHSGNEEHQQLKVEHLNVQQEDLYSVPDGFFDQMENDILAKTIGAGEAENSTDDGNVVNIQKSRIRTWWWSAAALLILGVGTVYFVHNSGSDAADTNLKKDYMAKTEATLDEMSNEDLMAYFEDVYGVEGAGKEIVDYAVNNGVEVDASESLPLDMTNEEIIDELSEMDIDIDIDDIY